MATLNFSYDTGNVIMSDILDALAASFGYVDGPESKAAFCKRMIAQEIIKRVREQKKFTTIKAIQIDDITLT